MLAAMRAASWMAFEPLLESGDLRAERSARSGTKKSDHRHRRLLRPRRERPRRRTAEPDDDAVSRPQTGERLDNQREAVSHQAVTSRATSGRVASSRMKFGGMIREPTGLGFRRADRA
jgi:hypothetical protein